MHVLLSVHHQLCAYPVLGLKLGNQVSAWISKTYSGFLLVLARGIAVLLDENGCTVRDGGLENAMLLYKLHGSCEKYIFHIVDFI